MAAPSLIFRSGGGAIIPALASFARELNLREKLRIDTTFLPVKAVYLLVCAGSVCLVPFISVYLAYVGLNPVQIGIAIGIQPLLGIVASPLSGSLADKYRMHRLLLISSLVGTGLVYGSGVFVPLLNANMTVQWTRISNETSFEHQIITGELPQELNAERNTSECRKHDKVDCFISALYDICACDSYFDNGLPGDNLNFDCESLQVIVNAHHCSIVKKSICVCLPYLLCEARLHTTLISSNITSLSHICEKKCTSSIEEPMKTLHIGNRLDSIDARIIASDNKMSSSPDLSSGPQADLVEGKGTSVVFPVVLVYLIVVQFVSNSFPLLDGTVMALIEECKKQGQHAEYGRQRLWGAVGWGIFAPLSGYAVDKYSATHEDSFNKYLPAFILCMSLNLLSVLPALLIRIPPRKPPESLSRDLGGLLRRPHVMTFFLVLFVSGMSIGVINTYLFLFLQQLSGSHTLMGLTKTLTCSSEVPFMFFAAWLIKKLLQRGVFSLALFCFAVRFAGYALLSNPWLVLPIELLHGITMGAMWPACASYVNVIAPESMVTTVQTLAYGTRMGLGQGVGMLLGGVVFHHFGARNLFWGMAVLCLATLIFYLPASTYFEKREAARTIQIQYEEI